MSLVKEISVTKVVVAFGVCLVFTWLWSLLNWVLIRPKRMERLLSKQGIPGNRYRIFHGDLKELKAMRAQASAKPMPTLSHNFFPRIRPLIHRAVEQYGKICLIWDGSIPVVNIGEVDLAKEIFAKYNEFHKPRLNPITNMLARGLFTYEGQKWFHHRKLLNPAFHMEKIKLMLPAFYTSCSEMMNLWEDKLSKSEQEIDISDYLTTLSADSISRAAFGSSYEEGKQIFQLIKEQVIVADKIAQSVYFPGLRPKKDNSHYNLQISFLDWLHDYMFLPTEKNKKMRGIDKEINNLLTGIIKKRKEGEELKDDLLGLLMESNLQKGSNNKKQKVRITTQEMIDECKLFYFAGQGTTSTLLIWTMILLSKHQDWQSRAREEVLDFGHKKPDFDGLSHLKTMNIIFQEAMRLYSPVIELKRKVMEDNTKLGDLTLPSGCTISLPLQYFHQDSDVWGDDAKEFNPERFAQGISKASKGGVSFLAFGWGPRICIASNFAMVEAKIALSMILQRFEFKLSSSYVHAPSSLGLLYPQFGAPLLFHRL